MDWRLFVIVAAVALLGFSCLGQTWQSEPFWPGMHYDSRHSGFSRLLGPKYPDAVVKWFFTAEGIGKINSSCAIGPSEPYLDGNRSGGYDDGEPYKDLNGNGKWDDCFIVFTSTGGFVYVLNPDGTLYWSYRTRSPMISSPAIGPGEPYYDANKNGCYDIAEPFTDTNRNGKYDAPEPFDDLNGDGEYQRGEPFDDLNGDGIRDEGDPFVDCNGNGVWDDAEPFLDENGNGVRDRAVFYFGCDDGRLYALYSEICEEPYVDSNGNGEYDPGEHFVDWNSNGRWDDVRVKWSVATGDRITSSPVVNVQEPFIDKNGNGRFDDGERFLDVFQDGRWSPSCQEPYEDLNKNGRFDADLPEPYEDSNHNGRRDGVMVYVGSHNGKLYGVSESGEVVWEYQTGSWITSSPAVSLDGKTVYCGSDDHYFYAIDAADGYLRWRRYVSSWIHSSPAVGPDGTVYIGSGSPDNRIYAFSPKGDLLWSRSVGTWVHSSPAIGVFGDVYCGTYYQAAGEAEPTGKLYGLLADGSGSAFAQVDPGCQGISLASWVESSPIVDDEGTIYIVSGDNTVYSVGPDGTILARMFLPAGSDREPLKNEYWIRSTPAIGPNRTLYVGCWDGKLYALQMDQPSPYEPALLVAGHLDTVISASKGGTWKMRALVRDPEQNVFSVKVYHNGEPTGMELTRTGYDEVADAMVFSQEFEIAPGAVRPGQTIIVELIAEDAVGNRSQTWPYITIAGEHPDYLAMAKSLWQGHRGPAGRVQGYEPSAPIVLMAGAPYTRITTESGGRVTIAAVVTDPDGVEDIASVRWQILLPGVLYGKDITEYGVPGLYADEMVYIFSFDVGPGALPAVYRVEVLATDREGNASTLFPMVTVIE